MTVKQLKESKNESDFSSIQKGICNNAVASQLGAIEEIQGLKKHKTALMNQQTDYASSKYTENLQSPKTVHFEALETPKRNTDCDSMTVKTEAKTQPQKLKRASEQLLSTGED